ncbi:MAG: AraC family transcriptional regulator [Bacteroidales bacterium]|nr:AraC family transcriptional regulator [Bacteroidales bacterium]MBN2818924.1 AraC family transcriptional regulator [Bacteroidales bacterium]
MKTPNTTRVQREYIGRINKVMDHIERNLDKNLRLESVSEIACFSPFHFHRIFSAITGETLNNFINRKRIESIAACLIQDKDLVISELAYQYGFNSSSVFSRAFKKYYGISPTAFKNNSEKYSKISKTSSKNGKKNVSFEKYICNITNIKNWLKMNAKIEVKEMPEFKLAYVSHVGDFNLIGQAYERLMKWAGPKGLFNNPDFHTVTVYHDDPQVTEISKVRQSACITLQKEIKPDGDIGYMTLSGGKFAVGRFEIGAMEFEQAWNSMCVWVTENGFSTRGKDFYELYHNDHTQHPEQKFILDICIPVN